MAATRPRSHIPRLDPGERPESRGDRLKMEFDKQRAIQLTLFTAGIALIGFAGVRGVNCHVEPVQFMNQEVKEDGLYVSVAQTDYTSLYFEGETEKLNVSEYEPMAVKWCHTFAGERVREVITPEVTA